MSDFGAVLRRLREQTGLKQREVAEAVGIPQPVLSRLETGNQSPRDRKTVIDLAAAMDLSPTQTDELLEAAGFQPQSLFDIPGLDLRDDNLRALFYEVTAVQSEDDPAWSAGLIEAMRIMLRGARFMKTEAVTGLVPAPPPEPSRLTAEEKETDTLLSTLLTGEAEPGEIARLLSALESGSLPWELRRRMAEALPTLVQLDAETTFRLAAILRDDYDPLRWHTDVRRRVVEAVPAMYAHDPEQGLALLEPQPQDQVYVHIAIAEALHDIKGIDPADANRIRHTLTEQERPEHVGMIEFLSGLLDQIGEGNARSALEVMKAASSRHRIFRTCVMRSLSRLLDTEVAADALWLMLYFYRRTEGRIAEHRNVRRPAVIAFPKLISLLDDGGEVALLAKMMIWQFAQEEEAIARRAVADELPRLMASHRDFAQQLADDLLMDSDPYVRRRVWSVKARATGENRG
jgi:transcriptional regulator with XRE-family HTH domain